MYLSDVTRRQPDWWASDPHAAALERGEAAACTGIRALRRLTRLMPVQRLLHAEKLVRVIPALFAMKATVEAERRAGDPHWLAHQRDLDTQVARAFGSGYRLRSEVAELAQARCELARARGAAWRVMSPAAVAAKITRTPTTERERLERRVEEILTTPPPRRGSSP
jgi:hypothetical protein